VLPEAAPTVTAAGDILLGTDPSAPPAPPIDDQGQRYSADDMNRARTQEKEKLYPQMQQLREEMSQLRQERDTRVAEEAAAAQAKTEAAAQAEKDKLARDTDVRSLLEVKEREWTERLEAERKAREDALTLLAKEQERAELAAYRQRAVAASSDNIMPELADMVQGGSVEEIDASIASLAERSARILESAQAAMGAQRQAQLGTRVTSPLVGGLEKEPGDRPITADDIKNMSMGEYEKYRSRLLGAAANSRGRGIFG
jgi:hypothetical protein